MFLIGLHLYHPRHGNSRRIDFQKELHFIAFLYKWNLLAEERRNLDFPIN
jgi:hypothetical protein